MDIKQAKLIDSVGLVTTSCIRNIAHHRAGYASGMDYDTPNISRDSYSNAFFVAVLEWCKIFGDHNADHYWPQFIEDPYVFLYDMLDFYSMTTEDYEDAMDEVRTFRDKFVAHLDMDVPEESPSMDMMLCTSMYLYDHLLANEGKTVFPHDAPRGSRWLYDHMFKESKMVYDKVRGDKIEE